MAPETTAQRLRTVLLRTLDLPAETDCDALRYQQEPRWDSVAHLQLIGELEEEFGVTIGNEDVLHMTSYADILEIIHRLDSGRPNA